MKQWAPFRTPFAPSSAFSSLRALCVSAVIPFFEAGAAAQIILPAVFGDHMVFQQNADAPIWGWAAPGEPVTVTPGWGAPAAAAVADERGRWRTTLRTPAAGGPFGFNVSGPKSGTVAVRDVLAGEVWLCSGQSNMEWPLRSAADGDREVAAAEHAAIRLFAVENAHAAAPRADCRGAWAACTPESAATFSAVAYSFGRELHRHLGVPIGLIASDWGGTVAEAWMSQSALRAFPEFAAELDMLQTVTDPNRRDRSGGWERWWGSLDEQGPVPGGWATAGFDDASWPTMEIPSTWAGNLGGFDGLLYLRRSIDLPAAWQDQPAALELGPIDDLDDAWVNGVHVGGVHEPGRWHEPRRYEVPARVLRGSGNVVAVRVLDTGGAGGVNGRPEQLRLVRGDDRVAIAGAWRFQRGRAARDLPAPPRGADIDRNAPTVLSNGMIAPLRPFAIAGVTWYQGESNRPRPEQYAALFPALIRDWRAAWGREIPFYFVQIAPFAYGGDTGQAAALREAQAAALTEPATGMVVTLDLGEPYDIHPRNKQEVGRRLALLARRGVYGEAGLGSSGPRLRSVRVEGSRVRIDFDDAGSGLELRDGRRGRFLVAGDDQRFAVADAALDGSTLVVSSPSVAAPVAVRYAWEAAPEARLFNREGLPAPPFRTDDWHPTSQLPPVTNDDEMASVRSAEPGFVPIFNGRDLDGWHNVNGAPSTWQVHDGALACSGLPTGVLRSDLHYESFVLEMEWRHLRPGGNAGVFVWSDPLTRRGQPFTRAIEVQVMDGSQGTGYTSDGDIFPIHGAVLTPSNGRDGSNRAFPTAARANPSPLWNHYRIECVDGAIALAVNGEVVTRGRDCSPRKGYLCLESEGSPVEYRNIRLRELPSSRPADPAETADRAEDFTPLYNGVDFGGWRFGPEHEGHFRAADWTIDYDGGGADLWTERSFADFVLVCDWRWTHPEGGDSGIYLRGDSKSQVNIWNSPIGSGEVHGYRTDADMPPDVWAAVTPVTAADAPIGQWNRFVITMRGDRLTVVLNGATVIDRARLPGVAAEGPIALQQHGSAIQFANLFIRELRE